MKKKKYAFGFPISIEKRGEIEVIVKAKDLGKAYKKVEEILNYTRDSFEVFRIEEE